MYMTRHGAASFCGLSPPIGLGAASPRSVAEGAPVGVDEGAGCGPATFQCHRRDVVLLGQQHQRVLQADLGAPLREGHAQLVAEQAAECALADAESVTDLLQAQRLGQVVVDQRAGLP